MGYFIQCPHCSVEIEVEEINCGIFRCGILESGNQLPPHSTEKECEEAKLMFGCGKPFRFDGKVVEKCGYL